MLLNHSRRDFCFPNSVISALFFVNFVSFVVQT